MTPEEQAAVVRRLMIDLGFRELDSGDFTKDGTVFTLEQAEDYLIHTIAPQRGIHATARRR